MCQESNITSCKLCISISEFELQSGSQSLLGLCVTRVQRLAKKEDKIPDANALTYPQYQYQQQEDLQLTFEEKRTGPKEYPILSCAPLPPM